MTEENNSNEADQGPSTSPTDWQASTSVKTDTNQSARPKPMVRSIQIRKLEAVRKRPGMYIGG
jgi:hypothetical protein